MSTSASGADPVGAAARNNAELCDLVARAHACAGVFATDAWTCPRRTPPFYPDAVTLVPDVEVDALLARIDGAAGTSVKDSFATLDLAPYGFRVLFDAEWIWHPGVAAVESSAVWSRVVDAAGLVEWESAWSEGEPSTGLFRPELLHTSELVMLRGVRGVHGGEVVAGVILNRSDAAVGVSNLFTTSGDLDERWRDGLAAIADRFPGVAVVGYERGPMLEAARRAGFRSVGPLRVWIND